VGQAIGFAIDRKAIVGAAFFGQGDALNGVSIPQSSPFYNRQYAEFWSYDPDKAKRLLAEAGYPNGFTATLLSNAQYAMHRDTAVVVQQGLGKIGVKVDLALPDWATRLDLGTKGLYDFGVMGSGGPYIDPDVLHIFTIGSSAGGRSFGYNSAVVNKLLDQGRATLRFADCKKVYDQLFAVFVQDVPILPLTWRAQAFGYQKYVKGFRALPGSLANCSVHLFESTELAS